MKETKQFQTESRQLLNLVINSIYSNKEIFLRELISNASDAIDKYHFLSLKAENNLKPIDHKIEIKIDRENRTLEIIDNGIGMTKEELENNLGTIAKSGSKEFLSKLKEAEEAKNLEIIGQFGVGFYSAFMVSSKIVVTSKSALGGTSHIFESDGKDSYTIDDSDSQEVGTSIKLFLKEDDEDEKYSRFLDQYTIERLVKQYSDYIRYPIVMAMTKSRAKVDENGKEIEGEYEDYTEVETLNSMIPLWKKKKSDVSQEELDDFYLKRFGDYEKPLLSLFLNVEGLVSYKALVYIPSHSPYDLYSDSYEKGLALYSKSVFIKEKCGELVPDYLKFIKGLVDSDDFSLNVSREILQDDRTLKKIRESIEKKVIDALKDLKKEDFDKYLSFFDSFGSHLKFGIYQSYGEKKSTLADLLVYDSLLSDKRLSLADYKSAMKEGQKYIYYAAGKSLDACKLLPQLEKFKESGIDVLLVHENIDEFTLMMMKDYQEVEFKSIGDESSVELTKEEQEKVDTLVSQNKEIIDIFKEQLKDKVDEVVFSTKLVSSPVCLSSKDGLSLNMEHVLNEEVQGNDHDVKASKVLEINPSHELFKKVQSLKEEGKNIEKYAALFYDEAMLLEGYEIKDKSAFIANLNALLLGN